MERYRGLALSGQVAYPDHVVDIPAAAVDEGFIRNLGGLIRRLAAETSARRVPSPMECRYCEITKADCPDRLEEVPAQMAAPKRWESLLRGGPEAFGALY